MDARLEDTQSIEALISSQEKLGVVSKTVQLGGAQELSTYLTKRETLEKLIPVMNDMIAQQYGINASQESAANIATMLGKVMDGQTGALSRYGYKFDEAQEKILKYGTEEERCAVLTEVITSSIGGMNEALGQTDAGKMAKLSAALENTQVRIGEIANEIRLSFAPMLSEIGNKAYDVGDSFGKLVESIISGDDDLSEEISNFKETVKILITEISNARIFRAWRTNNKRNRRGIMGSNRTFCSSNCRLGIGYRWCNYCFRATDFSSYIGSYGSSGNRNCRLASRFGNSACGLSSCFLATNFKIF